LRSAVNRIRLHFGFILSKYMIHYAIVAFVASIINAYIVVPSILEEIVMLSVKTPYYTPVTAPTRFVGLSLNLAHLIFSIVSLSLASSMARELSTTSLFHLSQPIKRSEYALSWLFAITLLPSVLMALSLFVPVASFDPRLVLRVGFQPIYLRLIEDFLVFSIFCWAALSKRQGIVAFIGLFFILIFPYLSLVLLSLIYYVLRATNPPNLLFTIYEVIFPSTASSFLQGLGGSLALDPMKASYGTLTISIAIQLVYFLHFTRRFEVR
jgi:hypothetical protein